MPRLLAVLAVAGAVAVTVGAAIVHPAAGWVVGGAFGLAAGLLIDPGGDGP